MGNLASGKSALVHRYLTGTYVQEESPEGKRFRSISTVTVNTFGKYGYGLKEITITLYSVVCHTWAQKQYGCYTVILYCFGLFRFLDPVLC